MDLTSRNWAVPVAVLLFSALSSQPFASAPQADGLARRRHRVTTKFENDAQNVWRRWMLAFNVPRPGGQPMPPGLMCCTSDSYPGMKSRADDEIRYIDAYVRGGVKLDYWWIDAGWRSQPATR